MSGTVRGGIRAAATNKQLYGKEFYTQIGRKGGLNGNHSAKGFAANRELAREAGRKGGAASGRGLAKKKPEASKPEDKHEMNTGSFWDKFRRFPIS